ncbi:Asparaginase/glutaminase [Dactylonectria macrodidyma]|uniref:asparaginase n=1 Tax=Dactylonectria macrodidyma TaxID=307937 RepID=A0A9P9DAJ2_9HYPO|nr:Asparaginase/glutaminase [Dactylonectria macrodidyma]
MKPIPIHQSYDNLGTHAVCHALKHDAGQEYLVNFHLPPDEKAVESDPTPLLLNSIEGCVRPHHSTINPALPNVLFIGSRETIAGVNSLHEPATEYTPGVVGIDSLLEDTPQLRDICNVHYKQVTNVDSIDIDSTILEQIRLGVQDGLNSSEYAGVVVWHETDTLEETAQYVQLTTLNEKPVVFTGAMRASTDLSPDGPTNLLGSAVVACSTNSKNRGVLVVFNNQIYSASMIMKTDSDSVDAFISQSRLGTVHNNIAQFLFQPSRPTNDHYLAVHNNIILPRVDIIYAHQGCGDVDVMDPIQKGARGLVLAGSWKRDAINGSLAMLAEHNFPVVMASHTMHGFVASGYGFVGAGYLSARQARIRLQLVIATAEDPRRFFTN